MDGVNRITERIARDTELQAEGILSLAREEAAAKGRHDRKTAEARRELLMEKARTNAGEIYQRKVADAELEVRKMLLSEKQALVAEVFDKVLVQLASLPPEKYSAFLVRLAVNAARTGTEEVLLNPEDRLRYGSEVIAKANAQLAAVGKEARLTLSEEGRLFSGGLILKSGAVESNCTLEVLTALTRKAMTAEVARLLFET